VRLVFALAIHDYSASVQPVWLRLEEMSAASQESFAYDDLAKWISLKFVAVQSSACLSLSFQHFPLGFFWNVVL
jgi:hypothetical protein